MFAISALIYAITIFGLGFPSRARLRPSDAILVPLRLPGVASLGVVSPGLLSIAAHVATTRVGVALSEYGRRNSPPNKPPSMSMLSSRFALRSPPSGMRSKASGRATRQPDQKGWIRFRLDSHIDRPRLIHSAPGVSQELPRGLLHLVMWRTKESGSKRRSDAQDAVAAENSKSEVNVRVLRLGAVLLRACSYSPRFIAEIRFRATTKMTALRRIRDRE
jgi:hypothetical protein